MRKPSQFLSFLLLGQKEKPFWSDTLIQAVWILKRRYVLVWQIQGCPCTPPWSDPWTFDIFYFFWSNSPPYGPFLWSNAALPRDVLGVKCPAPRAEGTKPRSIDFTKPEQGFQHCHLYYFLYTAPVQRLRSSFFFFCVHSDHLGFRYELSAFRTLQSSVSRQEEVQEHESVHYKFCNSRVLGSLSSGFNYWQRSKSFVKCS